MSGSVPPSRSEPQSYDVDALIVGAGFGGVYAVYKLRQLGLKIRLFEAGNHAGGTWLWNQYPGARVDSEFPFYQLSIPEVYRSWSWKERFPGYRELRNYFEHVDKVLSISKDTTFNAEVIQARFDVEHAKWTVTTKQGHTATSQHLILCTGSTYKQHLPDFPNIPAYSGHIYHSTRWPADGVDVGGKRVAVIGAGATGVQVVQELAKKVQAMTVYIRTPNLAIPMRQRQIGTEEQEHLKSFYDSIFKGARQSFGGFPYNAPSVDRASTTLVERRALYEECYARGGFRLVFSIWGEYLFDPQANRELYDFWAEKARARISDPIKRDILAPPEPVHPFGMKRPSLEQDYFECLDQENVEVIDLNKTPIEKFTETGIRTVDGRNQDFDTIVLATGFDSYTGAFSTMGLKDSNGVDLKDRWQEGVQTYMGLMCSGFPNLFMVYGPQAPTAIGNAPTIIECQIDIIADFISKARSQNLRTIEAEPSAEKKWTEDIQTMSKMTLYPLANSWYMGANIPGKKKEMLNYLAGLIEYQRSCREVLRTFEGLKTTP